MTQPSLRIGKNGITDSIITEIKNQLRTKKEIKIKLLPNYRRLNDRKKAAEEIAERTNSKLVMIRGGVVIIKK